VDPAAEGLEFPEVRFELDPARVEAFRKVFGLTQGVPPTFITAAEFAVLPTVIGDARLSLDFSRVVHSEQRYVFERPLVEGEVLRVRARIESIRQKGGAGFMTVVMDMFGEDDGLAATARSTMIERAAP
jgi:N-terminal half of MaoC dehydratase